MSPIMQLKLGHLCMVRKHWSVALIICVLKTPLEELISFDFGIIKNLFSTEE